MEHGKPQKQALAIAYAMKRRSMARGGKVDDPTDDLPEPPAPVAGGYASGGDVVDRIMRQRYSEGGVVANDDDDHRADEDPACFDDMEYDDHLEASYPGSEEIGDAAEDEDREDTRDLAERAFRARKDRNPRPA